MRATIYMHYMAAEVRAKRYRKTPRVPLRASLFGTGAAFAKLRVPAQSRIFDTRENISGGGSPLFNCQLALHFSVPQATEM